MKPDRPAGDNITDDVELEAFIEWLYQHGHTPFSMSRDQLKWIWMRGMADFHILNLVRPGGTTEQHAKHAEGLKHCLDQASTLAPSMAKAISKTHETPA